MQDKELKDKRRKEIWKIIRIGAISLIAILVTSHFVWKYSGSEEWKLIRNENGVKIWSLKTPGTSLLKFKASMNVKSKLTPIIFWLTSTETAADVDSSDCEIIEKIDIPNGYMAYEKYTYNMPFPFGIIEGVILVHVPPQDPVTKKIQVVILGAPNRIPPKKYAYRMTHLHDIWNITPLPNGEVEVEMLLDFSMDYLPYFVFNNVMPVDMFKMHCKMRELLKKDKNKNAKIAYIKEIKN